MSCIDTNNGQLIPSFTTLVLPTESPMNPLEFPDQVDQVVPEIDQPELDNASVSFLESSNIVEQIDFDTTSNNTVAIDRSPYWKISWRIISTKINLKGRYQKLLRTILNI